jgi:flavin reductase (DIM6/NTAB) family NADH-FMN oxidoreductase RutF
MDTATINRVMWAIPNVLCLVGSRAGDERNAMTTSWVTQVAMEPVLVAASVDATALTNRLIREGGGFSVNLWDRGDTSVFRRFSKPAEDDGTTLNGYPVRDGMTGAPIFADAIGWIECRLHEVVELGTHDLFIGEVVDVGLEEGAEDLVARMEDTRMKYGGVRRH